MRQTKQWLADSARIFIELGLQRLLQSRLDRAPAAPQPRTVSINDTVKTVSSPSIGEIRARSASMSRSRAVSGELHHSANAGVLARPVRVSSVERLAA